MKVPTKSALVDAKAVADELLVCTKTVRRWAADGRITVHRVGPRLLRYNLAEVRRELGLT